MRGRVVTIPIVIRFFVLQERDVQRVISTGAQG